MIGDGPERSRAEWLAVHKGTHNDVIRSFRGFSPGEVPPGFSHWAGHDDRSCGRSAPTGTWRIAVTAGPRAPVAGQADQKPDGLARSRARRPTRRPLPDDLESPPMGFTGRRAPE